MQDGGKIIAGLVIFVILISFPVWYNAVLGDDTAKPVIAKPTGESNCVLELADIRATHMELLNTWRDDVVRDGKRIHIGPKGKKFEKSLTNTCLNCHDKPSEFCDKCHDYAGVKVYCFDCHVNPEGVK